MMKIRITVDAPLEAREGIEIKRESSDQAGPLTGTCDEMMNDDASTDVELQGKLGAERAAMLCCDEEPLAFPFR